MESVVVTDGEWSVEEDLERAKALVGPSRESLEIRITLGKLLYDLRRRGVSQKRQSAELDIPRSRVSMLQRIGSLRS